MATSFTNNWKNIADKLQGKLRGEFGGSMPVFIGEEDNAGNQFLKILPVSNDLSEKPQFGEVRQYNFKFIYYFMDANTKKGTFMHMFRVLSRIESLIANNRSITLADSTTIIDGQISSYSMTEGSEGFEYLTDMDYFCIHLGNLS